MAKALEFLELDFHDPKEVLVAVSYGSVDYRDIGKRKGTFSKTIKMPSTKRNDAFFGYSFDVTNEGFFDNKIRVPITISEIDFDGTLQLKSVEILRGKVSSYDVNIFSDLADWVSLVGEGSIRDLTHHGQHTLTVDTIKESNLVNITGGSKFDFCYPLISYGGYLQPLTATDEIDVSRFRPAFYTLPLIRQTFKEAGYTFIDTDLLKTPFADEILPFTSKEVEFDDTIFDAEASHTGVEFGADRTSGANKTAVFINKKNDSNTVIEFRSYVPFLNEDKDDSNIFNNLTTRYVAPASGAYSITLDTIIATSAFSNKTGAPNENLGSYRLSIEITKSGGGVSYWRLAPDTKLKNITFFTQSVSSVQTINLSKDDVIRISLSITTYGIGSNEPGGSGTFKNKTTFSMWNAGGSMKIHPINLELAAGSIISHSKLIQNIKKIDLLRDTIAKGNFRILTDNQKKTVQFIGLDKFLLTESEDWTDKVDTSRPTTIAQIQNEGAKQLEWRYGNDSDDLVLKDLSDRFDTIWGRKRVDLDSEYRKGVRVVFESIFSATVDTGLSVGGLATPIMSKSEPIGIGELADEDIQYQTNFENRVLIYAGLADGSFNLAGEPQTQYPFAYFSTNNFTLNWRTESEILPTGSIGLVDRFYPITINQLNNSKMAAFWMNLNELDISTLSFRKIKIVDGNHYYLNLVSDYIVNNNQPTKVELISR